MLSDIWVYTRTAKLMIGLLLLAALLLARRNWPLGLLFFIIVAGVIVYVKRSDYGEEEAPVAIWMTCPQAFRPVRCMR